MDPLSKARLLPCEIAVRGAQERVPQEERVVHDPGAAVALALLEPPPPYVYVLHVDPDQQVSLLCAGAGAQRIPDAPHWLALGAAGYLVAVGAEAPLTRQALAELVGGREPDAASTTRGRL